MKKTWVPMVHFNINASFGPASSPPLLVAQEAPEAQTSPEALEAPEDQLKSSHGMFQKKGLHPMELLWLILSWSY